MTKDTKRVSPFSLHEIKSNPKPRQTRSIIKEFSLNTSTHGIPGIARSESIHNRSFWSIVLLIFTGIMTYFITQSIRAYFEYPTQTSVTIIREWPQAFPAITICNYSPLRYDRFIRPFLNYTNTTNFTEEQISYLHDYLTTKLNRNESLYDYFFSLESMMMYCSYNGMSCTTANFTWFMSERYGLCYTFNAQLKDSFGQTIKYNSDNGGEGIFKLRLYIHQHQYVPYLSDGIGAVILVHDNRQLPNIEMRARQLGPGQHHRLGYDKKTSHFLPTPYTVCSDELTRGMQAMFNEYHDTNYGYTESACFSACLQSYVYQKCGCGNPFLWAARFIVLPNSDETIHIPLCNISDPCYGQAASEMMNTESIWTSYCSPCQLDCTYIDFNIRSTSLLAPPVSFMKNIKEFVESSEVPLPQNWSTSWVSEIQSSYVSIEVAYETTRSEIYSQQATISAVDVISNVGGHTGLWIGISFLSLMEIIEMIYRLSRVQWLKFWQILQKKPTMTEMNTF